MSANGEDAVLGVIEIDRPHKCQPGRYVDPEQGVLYANNAPEGTVWRCSCGALYVHHYVGYWRSRFSGMEWQPATKKERKAVEGGQFGSNARASSRLIQSGTPESARNE